MNERKQREEPSEAEKSGEEEIGQSCKREESHGNGEVGELVLTTLSVSHYKYYSLTLDQQSPGLKLSLVSPRLSGSARTNQ